MLRVRSPAVAQQLEYAQLLQELDLLVGDRVAIVIRDRAAASPPYAFFRGTLRAREQGHVEGVPNAVGYGIGDDTETGIYLTPEGFGGGHWDSSKQHLTVLLGDISLLIYRDGDTVHASKYV
jgi:hypothetical protein